MRKKIYVGFTGGRTKEKKCSGEETGMGYFPFSSPGRDIAGRVATGMAWARNWPAWPGSRPSTVASMNTDAGRVT